jgi:hypothetical protein
MSELTNIIKDKQHGVTTDRKERRLKIINFVSRIIFVLAEKKSTIFTNVSFPVINTF